MITNLPTKLANPIMMNIQENFLELANFGSLVVLRTIPKITIAMAKIIPIIFMFSRFPIILLKKLLTLFRFCIQATFYHLKQLFLYWTEKPNQIGNHP